MSRHRLVRNMNIHGESCIVSLGTQELTGAATEELDDDAMDDGEDELTPEQEGV